MIVAGVGCRRGATAPDIEAAIRAALARANISADALDVIATMAEKKDEAGIRGAAEKLGVAVVIVSKSALEAANDRTTTRSERVRALMGIPSVAEAAAVAAAGPLAQLIGPRLAVGPATCAIATSDETPRTMR